MCTNNWFFVCFSGSTQFVVMGPSNVGSIGYIPKQLSCSWAILLKDKSLTYIYIKPLWSINRYLIQSTLCHNVPYEGLSVKNKLLKTVVWQMILTQSKCPEPSITWQVWSAKKHISWNLLSRKKVVNGPLVKIVRWVVSLKKKYIYQVMVRILRWNPSAIGFYFVRVFATPK